MARWWLALGALIATGACTALIGACVLGAPRYTGPKSDHFDGQVFVNAGGVTEQGTAALLQWVVDRDVGPWRTWTDAPRGTKPPARVGAGDLRATFVNHATVLLQMDGLNILTDPIWSDRASPVRWAGPSRVRPPGIRFDDLPPIDVVLISHNHYDHMDLPTLERLHARDAPRMFVGLGNRPTLEGAGIERVQELDWWGEQAVGDVTVISVPVQHFSNRSFTDRNYTLWTGYVIDGPAGRVYFAGDTGFGPHFEAVGQRFGPLRLALLPIGAYKPEWFMHPIHISPAEAVAAHQKLRAFTSLAIHFGTFMLGDDGQHEPVRALAQALDSARLRRRRFWVLGFGEGRDVPQIDGDDAPVGGHAH